MRARPYKFLALALALLLGQWLVLAHGLQHEDLTSDPDCSVCAHIHHLGSAAPSVISALPDSTHLCHEDPTAITPSIVATAPLRRYLIRGPPVTLAA